LAKRRLPSVSPERVRWLESEVNVQFAEADSSAIKSPDARPEWTPSYIYRYPEYLRYSN
jgi:hypothetical protein